MFPYLFEAWTSEFWTEDSGRLFLKSNLGALVEASSCQTEYTLNGEYQLSMEYPTQASLSDELQLGRIILAESNNCGSCQPFFISNIETNNADGSINVTAYHISYLLSQQIAMQWQGTTIEMWQSIFDRPNEFFYRPSGDGKTTVDMTVNPLFSISYPEKFNRSWFMWHYNDQESTRDNAPFYAGFSSVRNRLMGTEGLIEEFGGEINFDHFMLEWQPVFDADTKTDYDTGSQKIGDTWKSYYTWHKLYVGKDIAGVTITQSIDSFYTGCFLFFKDGNDNGETAQYDRSLVYTTEEMFRPKYHNICIFNATDWINNKYNPYNYYNDDDHWTARKAELIAGGKSESDAQTQVDSEKTTAETNFNAWLPRNVSTAKRDEYFKDCFDNYVLNVYKESFKPAYEISIDFISGKFEGAETWNDEMKLAVGDYVEIYDPINNFTSTERILKLTYDVIGQKNLSCEIGKTSTSLAETILNTENSNTIGND